MLNELDVGHYWVHDARHTAATVLLVRGVDTRIVMDSMGWAQASMLKRYQHVVDELRIEAARRMGTLALTRGTFSTTA